MIVNFQIKHTRKGRVQHGVQPLFTLQSRRPKQTHRRIPALARHRRGGQKEAEEELELSVVVVD